MTRSLPTDFEPQTLWCGALADYVAVVHVMRWFASGSASLSSCTHAGRQLTTLLSASARAEQKQCEGSDSCNALHEMNCRYCDD